MAFNSTAASAFNATDNPSAVVDPTGVCKPGLLLPVWEADDNPFSIVVVGVFYFLALCYSFVGVSIIADRFMAGIEMITSQEKDVIVTSRSGVKEIISVRIWNETVSNLTLMALGSSAPEIFLTIIEVYGNNFESGDLGPGTIVGSAAFNMFVIIAVCVFFVPNNQIKKIKHLRVFCITLAFSLFAYLWLLFILVGSSPGVITVFEGLITFLLFPATVLLAYIADRRLLVYKYLSKEYRVNKRGFIVGSEGNTVPSAVDGIELGEAKISGVDGNVPYIDASEQDILEFEEDRQATIEILKRIKSQNPNATPQELEDLARDEVEKLKPKSRAFYRIQIGNRLITGSKRLKHHMRITFKDDFKNGEEIDKIVKVFFNPPQYTVREDVDSFPITVTRAGPLDATLSIDYETEDGTAKKNSDYVYDQGTIIFGPGEQHKQITIKVINDDVFEEDEFFYVQLSNPRFMDSPGEVKRPEIVVLEPSAAKVIILDDDHSGMFAFNDPVLQVPESVGEYKLKVLRYCGARGKVSIPFKTIPVTAKDGKDFIMTEGKLIFENNETFKEIALKIIDNDTYEKNVTFHVELGDPKREDQSDNQDPAGLPKLGETSSCLIRIRESKEFKETVDKLIKKARTVSALSTSSWEEQFVSVFHVPEMAEPDEDQMDQDVMVRVAKKKSFISYIVHYLLLFWKAIFACVPPPTIWNGWACFWVSVIIIGILTALIGDLASHFGCNIRLKDAVTAISIVALGTSIPDTFASKIAAENDKYADSSIGNVTGSNAVNVFLGIGIAWTLAAIYHAYHGTTFYVTPGSLGFSVTLFCIMALICASVLFLKRKLTGGELGGVLKYRLSVAVFFVGLWIFYIVVSSLEVYGYIRPGF